MERQHFVLVAAAVAARLLVRVAMAAAVKETAQAEHKTERQIQAAVAVA
jgi:hypothetical protein